MSKLDQALDGMSPAELQALEADLDKSAEDRQIAHLYGLGQKLAQEAFEEYKKSGTMTPAMALVKGAMEKKSFDASLDVQLDKCSAEELKALEAELDEKLGEDPEVMKYVQTHYEAGKKLARTFIEDLKKEAAGVGGAAAFAKMPLMSKLKTVATQHPLATAAAAGGAGFLLGDRK